MANKINEDNYIHADTPAKWIKNSIDENLKDEGFRKILDFFVIFTPCKELSERAKSLEDVHGWNNTYTLKKAMRIAPQKESIFAFGEKWEEMKDVLIETQLVSNFPLDNENERGCFYKKSNQNQLECIFYHIRNCFAHGRFDIIKKKDDWIICMEDFGQKHRLSARMILKKSTLLKWIEIIEGGEKAFSERKL